jgi:gas vesicle protein
LDPCGKLVHRDGGNTFSETAERETDRDRAKLKIAYERGGVMAEKSSGDVFMAFLLGGLVGAALGILYAPSSGKETRQKIKEKGDDLTDKFNTMSEDVKNRARHMVAEGKEKIESSKERLEEAFEAGKKAFEKKQQTTL